ncbi:hypothetical protein AVEN_2484-1 [Araneus ventricosus]|uniref:C2H2-type domain-containing protein n=1 Tax=Araneus ventricosus TaxID=182803 RepID=A0A4Y2TRE9_ARAVE|nr:hypothetical protein AVEN_2484-1 [Araneus ventricosus]
MNGDESSNVNTRMDGEENSNIDMQVITDQAFICNICNIGYTLYSSLKRHFKNIHPTQLDNLITPARASKIYQFHCVPCGKNFTKEFHFDYHNRKQHSSEVVPVSKTSVSCFSCGLETEKQNYVGHLQNEHGILIESEVLELSNMEEFYSWKARIEKESKENFVVERGAKRWSKNKSYYFACHRSGFQIKHSDSKKCSKLKGCKKINGFCPASIKLTCSEETGKCQVKFIKTHIGHSNDLAHLYLTHTPAMILFNGAHELSGSQSPAHDICHQYPWLKG